MIKKLSFQLELLRLRHFTIILQEFARKFVSSPKKNFLFQTRYKQNQKRKIHSVLSTKSTIRNFYLNLGNFNLLVSAKWLQLENDSNFQQLKKEKCVFLIVVLISHIPYVPKAALFLVRLLHVLLVGKKVELKNVQKLYQFSTFSQCLLCLF